MPQNEELKKEFTPESSTMRGVGSLQSLGLGCGIGVPPADIPDRTEMGDGTQSLAKETNGLLSAADSAFKSIWC